MAWTAPRTYVAEEVISAAIFNVDLRDNLLVLSTHAHSGAAGMGDDELAGVDSIAFDDLAASPNVAGELQRNGVNLEWYGAAVVKITEADAAAATASPRTLGTGAQQAAAGTHTHNPTSITSARNEDDGIPAGSSRTATAQNDFAADDTYLETNSLSVTPGAANRALTITYTAVFAVAVADTVTLRILVDAVEKITRARVTGAGGSLPRFESISVSWLESNPSVAAHTLSGEIKAQNAVGGGARTFFAASTLEVHEVKVS